LSGYTDFLSRGKVAIPPPIDSYQWKLICLDSATGKTLWEKVVREGRPTMTIHANNTYASETPATDGERVIAYFGMTGVYCYDLAGELLWTRELGTQKMQFGWGTGSSPVLFGDCVYIQCDNDESSFLVALDKKTGQDAWRKDRDEKSNWATPYIWRNKLRTELVTAGGKQMRSYDPKSGELLWSMNGNGRTATTPVGNDELLFVDSYDRLTGLGGYLAAVRPGASGDISLGAKETSSEQVAWTAPFKGGRIASPALCQDYLFALEHGGGVIRCFDARTGTEQFRKRLPNAAGITSSPIVVGDKVYCTDQNCTTFVIQAGKELQVLATNDLGEFCWSSPAVAGDTLLIRTVDHLFAIGPSRSNAAVAE
jgi:outer membrane protein assembly factor BamB